MLQSGCIRQVQPNSRTDASLVKLSWVFSNRRVAETVSQVRQIGPGPHKAQGDIGASRIGRDFSQNIPNPTFAT